MRTFKARLFLPVVSLVFLLAAPRPAQAWFGWLDNLSGPGPFNGAEFDFRVVCFMDQPSSVQAGVATATAMTITDKLLRESFTAEQSRREDVETLRRSMDGLFIGVDPKKRELALAISSNADTVLKNLATVTFPENHMADREAALFAWEAAKLAWRESAVPKISAPARFGFWASCTNRLRNEPEKSDGVGVRHVDRHPVVSLVLNYRDLANTGFFHLTAENALHSNQAYAGGKAIHLRILEPKVSWPLSGRFDFLDGQAGAGVYRFSSEGFKEGSGSFSGLVVEPIRFDLHFPGSLVDKVSGKNSGVRFLKRFPLSVSYSAGVLMFPGGFSSTQFSGGNPGDAGRAIPGSEAIFEQGVVINVGRLFGL